jgi:hypothetical protein
MAACQICRHPDPHRPHPEGEGWPSTVLRCASCPDGKCQLSADDTTTTRGTDGHAEEYAARLYVCRCGLRCKTPEDLAGHLDVHNASHGPGSPEARAALVLHGTTWHVRKDRDR